MIYGTPQRVAIFVLVLALAVVQAAAQGNKKKGGLDQEDVGCFYLRSASSDVIFEGEGEPFCHNEDGQVSVPKRFRYDSNKFNPENGEVRVNLSRSADGCTSTDVACLNAHRLVNDIQSELQYSVDDSSGEFVYAGGTELDFTGMYEGQVAGVSVKSDFRVEAGGQGLRRLRYGTSVDGRVKCPVDSKAEPVEVICNCSDEGRCRDWTLRAQKACLVITKTGEVVQNTLEAPWELRLVASGPACLPSP